MATIVVDQIVACWDRGFYKLHAFVRMPEHLHVRIPPSDETTIEKDMQMIKGGSAHRMGAERAQQFPIWHRGFHDLWIRDAEPFWKAKSYIEQNPVKARLVEMAEDYTRSSAAGEIVMDPSRFEEARG